MRPAQAPSDAAAAPVVVALGASAGGLEALRQLLPQVPVDSGLAFVVILHLDPARPSMLARILEGVTPLSVVEAADGMPLAPNRVHVIPPDADLAIRDGSLALVARGERAGLHLPFDAFLRALADDRRDQAIGVVPSGSGVDGTEGLRAIKAAGGITMAQEPGSAQFRSMPASAIATGGVDFCGTPAEIARELARLGRHPYLVARRPAEGERPGEPEPPGAAEGLADVLRLVRQRAGLDFSCYKRTTVLRRIERRMALRRASGLPEYLAALREDPAEARALAQDMLIHVTAFFRDPEAFAALQERALRTLVARKREVHGGSIRIWVPGCSTGQEAYAIAICLLEVLPAAAEGVSIKLFGTDLSAEAIDAARAGVYPAAAMGDVSSERLARFFDPAEGGYRIGKRVRDLCVFVKHDLTRDPPFARLDLISCRNVLIYFDADLQRRVLPVLHYCLNEGGYLFLGQSEAIGGFRDLFEPVDAAHRLFAKVGESRPGVLTLSAGREADLRGADRPLPDRRHPAREAQRQADHLLLARYAPVGVLVNDRLEVVQFRGRTGAYLEPPPGQPQANVLRMAREGLAPHLHEALERAAAESVTVRREGLRVRAGDEVRAVNLEVLPLQGTPGRPSGTSSSCSRSRPRARRGPSEGRRRGSAGEPRAGTRAPEDRAGATRGLHAVAHDGPSDDRRRPPRNEELIAVTSCSPRTRAAERQGGAAIHGRGLRHRQRRAPVPQRAARPARQRPRQRPLQRRAAAHHRRPGAPRAALHADRARGGPHPARGCGAPPRGPEAPGGRARPRRQGPRGRRHPHARPVGGPGPGRPVVPHAHPALPDHRPAARRRGHLLRRRRRPAARAPRGRGRPRLRAEHSSRR
ncbi:MAG: hypothetical protein KIT58_07515 [Planctomycetota bacterium]|nr:hypothetical protein [Planctomycetota bacterium]